MNAVRSDAGQIVVTTTLHARPGEEKALMAALAAFAAIVEREEAGCVRYEPVRSKHEPTRFLVLERYRDEQALLDHANAAHFAEALPRLMNCLASPPEVAVFATFDRD